MAGSSGTGCSNGLLKPKTGNKECFSHRCTWTLTIPAFNSKNNPTEFVESRKSFQELAVGESDDFWVLRVRPFFRSYPRGQIHGTKKNFVSVFLHLQSDRRLEIQAHFTIRIIDETGLFQPVGSASSSTFDTFICNGVGTNNWGWDRFVEHDKLRWIGALKDDCLRMRITIRFSEINESFSKDCLSLSMSEIFESGAESDLTIISSDGKEFSVHSFPLSLQTSLLKGQLQRIKELKTECRIHCKDIDSETLLSLLKFLYGCPDWMPESVEKLAVAATNYKIFRLEWKCISVLKAGLTMDTAASLLKMADSNGMSSLKEYVVDFIANDVAEFAAVGGYEEIGPGLMRDIRNELSQRRTMPKP